MNSINIYKFIIGSSVAVFLSYMVGWSASIIQSYSLINWYPLLDKSILSPPNIVFPIVWGVIYLLTGISAGIIWAEDSYLVKSGIVLFIIQLLLNFMWSITFFYLQSPSMGFVNIILLLIALVFYMKRCKEINRVAYWLNVPYLIWLFFATYLNGYIVLFN